jgi:hypothetical protein
MRRCAEFVVRNDSFVAKNTGSSRRVFAYTAERHVDDGEPRPVVRGTDSPDAVGFVVTGSLLSAVVPDAESRSPSDPPPATAATTTSTTTAAIVMTHHLRHHDLLGVC